MTGLDLYSVQNLIIDHIESEIPWDLHEGGVEEAHSVAQSNGVRDPYMVIRFSDGSPQSGDESFKGTRYSGMYSVVDVMCVAATSREARGLRSMVDDKLLGLKVANSSEITKWYGGGNFNVPANNSVPAYYITITSFRFHYNMIADGTGYDGT